ncbi:branched-chain amino acid aminotransferase [Algoriphagus zhangzhouensis]|uniref:branched-chain-amino-acid transaminase n=1 Tax=Algoriphagus zhangzhouensis TaxID=1073327 RepID=A0A1M7Z402_9BACT|nr:branched-chain amino acid aminotransferase [Algoriphagus zhangzhouensis]TDY48537.1 branched chain amino acid aminotransferase [Algoriphagus zhangzhouensis]SHO59585.1 branched-chain amino acid aminotransferase [Algoriphagus zhangzhouensis]
MKTSLAIPVTKTQSSRLSQTDFSNLVFGKTISDHMFVADYKNGEWTDLRIEPYAPLDLSPSNATLHYGQSIFEGLKAYRNDAGEILVFRADANWKRMNESAERMCMPSLPEEVFMDGLTQLVELDKDWVPSAKGASLYIRPFMFAMDEYIGVKPSDTYKFIIFTCPVGNYYSKPVSVKVETKFTRANEGGTGAAKTAGNYAASLYPALQAQKAGYDQLLWTDGKSHSKIEESGTMNVMFKINGKIITAPIDGGTILKGITRNSVIQLANDWNEELEERFLTVTELKEALEAGTLEEAFGTGTAATIAHIFKINIDGTDYILPEKSENAFSHRVLAALDGIKYGTEADPHEWIIKI